MSGTRHRPRPRNQADEASAFVTKEKSFCAGRCSEFIFRLSARPAIRIADCTKRKPHNGPRVRASADFSGIGSRHLRGWNGRPLPDEKWCFSESEENSVAACDGVCRRSGTLQHQTSNCCKSDDVCPVVSIFQLRRDRQLTARRCRWRKERAPQNDLTTPTSHIPRQLEGPLAISDKPEKTPLPRMTAVVYSLEDRACSTTAIQVLPPDCEHVRPEDQCDRSPSRP
jgi:hypothetical protein